MKTERVAGFGIVEVIVSVALAATALGAVFAVISMVIRLTNLGQDRLIASQLAREGLAAVRQIRDANFASNTCLVQDSLDQSCNQWWHGLSQPGQSPVFWGLATDTNRGFKLVAPSSAECGDETTIPRQDGKRQKFCRRIFIEPVADVAQTEVNERQRGLRIRSQVTWLGHGKKQFHHQSVLQPENKCSERRQSTEWCTEQVTILTDWRPGL